MKLLVLSLTLCTLNLSAHAEVVPTVDFCLAKEAIIPYSPLSRILAECNDETIEATAFFGHHLDQKFEKRMKAAGYNVVMKLQDHLVISKKNRSEITATELCFANQVIESHSTNITCEDGSSFSLNSPSDKTLNDFINKYKYTVLQAPQGNQHFYILGQSI